MDVFTVSQEIAESEHLSDQQWLASFTSLAKAKYAIEEEIWEFYCIGWEDALEYGYEFPEIPPFRDFQNDGFLFWDSAADETCDARFAIAKTMLF